MKRMFGWLLIFIMGIGLFSVFGCAKDDFVLVEKIVFTTNGETKTEKSYSGNYVYEKKISKEEYEEAEKLTPEKFHGYKTGAPTLKEKLKQVKGETYSTYTGSGEECATFYSKVPREIGITVARWDYYKCNYEYTYYYFVYVQVINDTTIVVRNNKNTTTYTVTSYSITYFE